MSHSRTESPVSQLDDNDGNSTNASSHLERGEADSCEDHSAQTNQDTGQDAEQDVGQDAGKDAGEARNSNPRTLRVQSHLIGGLIIDLISALFSIALFVFAVLGYSARGTIIGSREQKLLDTARIVATAFPFLFAFIVGKALQGVLSWRLERGIDCLSLAYLSRGSTLGSTCTAPFRIRCTHWLPAVLITLWAFSPLGSQASLRFIFQEQGIALTRLTDAVQYAYPLTTGDSDCGQCQAPAHNSIFLSSFLSLDMYGPAAQDAWGNIKIPLLDAATDTDAADGWISVPLHADLQYSALIGIPFSKPQGIGNMTFMMHSWYWQLENATLWGKGSQAPLLMPASEHNSSSNLKNFTSAGGQWQFAIPQDWNSATASLIPITFEVTPSYKPILNSMNVTYDYGTNSEAHSAARLEAVLTQRPVELNVTCTTSSCNVTAVRNTTLDENHVFMSDISEFGIHFLTRLTQAFPVEHVGTDFYGVLEAYLWNPSQNPYNVLSTFGSVFDLTRLDSQTLARRLSQILNTYWIVDNQFANAAGGFNTSDTILTTTDATRNSSITTMTAEEFLRGRDPWFILLCISTLTMLLASIASATLNFVRLAPDSTTFLSALTLNDGQGIIEGGSYLDEDERVRLLRNTRLMIGDRKADEEIGQVMIGEDGELGALKKDRLYW